MATIVLATGNPHKVEELRAILGAEGVEVIGLGDVPGGAFAEPVEHAATIPENARLKAVGYAMQISARGEAPGRGKVWCLADDSGIEIDALRMADGTPRPGVISSHYCTDGAERGMSRAERDAANNARVLRELEGVRSEGRAARFVCCMCLADLRGNILCEARGTMEGRIGVPPRVPSGGNGFGYDPLFLVEPAFERTGAELSAEEKNRLSHRGAAGRQMCAWLAQRSMK